MDESCVNSKLHKVANQIRCSLIIEYAPQFCGAARLFSYRNYEDRFFSIAAARLVGTIQHGVNLFNEGRLGVHRCVEVLKFLIHGGLPDRKYEIPLPTEVVMESCWRDPHFVRDHPCRRGEVPVHPDQAARGAANCLPRVISVHIRGSSGTPMGTGRNLSTADINFPTTKVGILVLFARRQVLLQLLLPYGL